MTPSWCQGDRSAPPRLLDEEGFGERHEVLAVDRRHDRKQLGVAVEPHAGLRELERPEDEVDYLLRGVRGRDRLQHLDRVPAVREIGAAEGIGKRLRPEEGRGLAAVTEGGSTLRIHRGVLLARKAVEDVEDIGLDVGEFLFADHPLEDVEAAAPVGVEDVRRELSVLIEADRAAVPEREGAALAFREVCLEGSLFRAVVCAGRLAYRRRHRLARRSAHPVLPPCETAIAPAIAEA